MNGLNHLLALKLARVVVHSSENRCLTPCCVLAAQQYQIPVYGTPGTLPAAQGIPVAMPADGSQVPLYPSKGHSDY